MKTPRAAVLLANADEAPDPATAKTACDLARRAGARLFVVHVTPSGCPAAGCALPSKIPGYAVLACLVAQCESAGGIVTRANLRLGAADDEILAEAGEIGAGLIVVAGAGSELAQRAHRAELGETLARRASCPVLIVRDNEPGNPRVRLTIAGRGTTAPRAAAR